MHTADDIWWREKSCKGGGNPTFLLVKREKIR